MAAISGYDSSSLGVLFSSLNTGSTRTTSFGTSDLLGINYTDYATIRNGSYTKLLKAYYAKDASDASSSSSSSTSTSKDSTALLGRIQSAADDLTSAEQTLQKNGNGSVFAQTKIKDSDGKETTGYDTDKIYKAVKEFTDSYNSLLEQGGDSNTNSILRKASSLVNLTKANSRMLSAVGITIGADNKLSIDEKKFKESDMNKVKTLFHEKGGYGHQASVQAGMMKSYAKSEAEKANTYGKTGMYTYNYTTGELYNSAV